MDAPTCDVRRFSPRFSKLLVTVNHTHTWWYNMSPLRGSIPFKQLGIRAKSPNACFLFPFHILCIWGRVRLNCCALCLCCASQGGGAVPGHHCEGSEGQAGRGAQVHGAAEETVRTPPYDSDTWLTPARFGRNTSLQHSSPIGLVLNLFCTSNVADNIVDILDVCYLFDWIRLYEGP